MSVKIVYEDIAVGAKEDAEIQTSDSQPFSHPTSLAFGTTPEKIASLETNQYIMNGEKKLLNGNVAWFISDSKSDIDCKLNPAPVVSIVFDEQYTSQGIYLTFDPVTGAYCTDITIRWYQGSHVLAEQNFKPDSTDYFCSRAVIAYNRVDIILNETSMPDRYAILSKIIFGIVRTFDLNELRNVRVTESANIISEEVEINTMDFTLDSKSDVEFLFQLKQPMRAYNGNVLIGAFYIDNSTRRGANLYDITCIDAIGVLDEERIPAKMCVNTPLRTLLEDIIGGHFELDLAEDFTSSVVNGYIPECTRREALQQVAFQAMAIVDTSGTESIMFYKPQSGTPEEIPIGRQYTGGNITSSSIVTAVKVTAHSYSTENTGGETVEVDGMTYYHSTEVYTINNPNVTATDKQNVIEVTDATLVNPSNVRAIAENTYNYYNRRDTYNTKIVVENEMPGDFISCSPPWGTTLKGHIKTMDLTLSNITAANCEIIGT